MKIKILTTIIVGLVVLCAILAYQNRALATQLYRAEYFAQSGLITAQQLCAPVITQLRDAESLTPDLKELARACIGQSSASDDAEYESVMLRARTVPAALADYVERRLRKEKHLPFCSYESVDPSRMPAQYYDENKRAL